MGRTYLDLIRLVSTKMGLRYQLVESFEDMNVIIMIYWMLFQGIWLSIEAPS